MKQQQRYTHAMHLERETGFVSSLHLPWLRTACTVEQREYKKQQQQQHHRAAVQCDTYALHMYSWVVRALSLPYVRLCNRITATPTATYSMLVENVRFADSEWNSTLPSAASCCIFSRWISTMDKPVEQAIYRRYWYISSPPGCSAEMAVGGERKSFHFATAIVYYTYQAAVQRRNERRNKPEADVWRHLENSKIVKNGWNAMSYWTRAQQWAHHLHSLTSRRWTLQLRLPRAMPHTHTLTHAVVLCVVNMAGQWNVEQRMCFASIQLTNGRKKCHQSIKTA